MYPHVSSSDLLNHAASEIASGSKLGMGARSNCRANPESFRGRQPLIKMDAAVKVKIDALFGGSG